MQMAFGFVEQPTVLFFQR